MSPSFSPKTLAIVEQAVDGLGTGAAKVQGFRRVRAERMEVDVDCASGALLVFSESHYPGWQVEIDGADTPLLRVDHALMGVRVPAGASEVVFEYRPARFRWGALLSAVAALALLGMALWAWRSRRRSLAIGGVRP